MSQKIRNGLFLIALSFLIILILFEISFGVNHRNTEQILTFYNPYGVTWGMMAQLSEGMTIEEVTKIFGSSGTVASRTIVEGNVIEFREWQSRCDRDAGVLIMFSGNDDDGLFFRAGSQSGLSC